MMRLMGGVERGGKKCGVGLGRTWNFCCKGCKGLRACAALGGGVAGMIMVQAMPPGPVLDVRCYGGGVRR